MIMRSSISSGGRLGVVGERSQAIHPLTTTKSPRIAHQPPPRSTENNADDEDESEWTLRALSSLDKKERVFDEDKSPRTPFSAPVSQTPMLAAVQDLIKIVETEVLDSHQQGRNSNFEGRKRLVLAVEWAKHEIAADERRRLADWTRVLALCEDLGNQPKNVFEFAKELQQLAQIRVKGDFTTEASIIAKASTEGKVNVIDRPKNDSKVPPQIIDDDGKSSSSSGDSNQHEEDDRETTETDHEHTIIDDWSDDGPTEALSLGEIELIALKTSAKRPLSLTVAEPIKKEIQEPKLHKSSTINSNMISVSGISMNSTTSGKASRLKFQFPEADLTQWQDVDDDTLASSVTTNAAASNLTSLARRRVSAAATTSGISLVSANSGITGAVPLRRKSFSMKRSPRKSLNHIFDSNARSQFAVTSSTTTDSPKVGKPRTPAISSMRRKSTTAFDIKASAPSTSQIGPSRRKSFSRLAHLALSPGRPPKPSSRRASMLAASPSKAMALATSSIKIAPASSVASCSQLVLRVRERRSDGVRELVMRKRSPGMTVVWQWQDRRRGGQSLLDEYERFIKLGPHQHGVMLRQLRYVKSAMHDLPWAKSHLRDLLARYTSQELSKEALYPQLALLSTQVQSEVSARAARNKEIAARKHKLTVQLTLATGVVNDVRATKYGRRGRPHATRLCYDPSDPLRLRWIRKSGERSDEFLPVDELQVLEQGRALGREGSNFSLKRLGSSSSESESDDCGCLLSIVTTSGSRALDLRVKSPLHREWLATALREISSFARQFRAVGAGSCVSTAASPRHLRIQNDI